MSGWIGAVAAAVLDALAKLVSLMVAVDLGRTKVERDRAEGDAAAIARQRDIAAAPAAAPDEMLRRMRHEGL